MTGADTPTSSLIFVRLAQLQLNPSKDIDDLIQRIQTLALEYKQAVSPPGSKTVDDDALKMILINQAMGVPEYREVVKGLVEKGELGEWYTVAKALQAKWRTMRQR